MEYRFNEISLPTVAINAQAGHSASQAQINGSIPLPNDRTANRLLAATGSIETTNVEVAENRIQLEGISAYTAYALMMSCFVRFCGAI